MLTLALLLLPLLAGLFDTGTPTTDTYAPAHGLALALVVSGLESPLFLTAPRNDARLFVIEQPGRIRIVKGGRLLSEPFLDLTLSVSYGGERGLLGMEIGRAHV